jgi:hypothetical protein
MIRTLLIVTFLLQIHIYAMESKNETVRDEIAPDSVIQTNCSFASFGEFINTNNSIHNQTRKKAPFQYFGFTGLSKGPETILGFPKIGVLVRPPFKSKILPSLQYGFSASIFPILILLPSIGAEVGFYYKYITMDASLTYTFLSQISSPKIADPDSSYTPWTFGPIKKLTLNPKIGFTIGSQTKQLWLRMGTSYNLKEFVHKRDLEDPDPPPIMRIFFREGSSSYLNYELFFLFKIPSI